jgi:hypothetical protein
MHSSIDILNWNKHFMLDIEKVIKYFMYHQQMEAMKNYFMTTRVTKINIGELKTKILKIFF